MKTNFAAANASHRATGAAFLLAVSAVLAACGDTTSATPAPSHIPTKPVRLTFDSPVSLALGFGATTEVSVRVSYVDDGTPAADVKVSFAMTGQGGDVTLAATEVVSNAKGVATTTLTAGATFVSLAVTASAAEPAGATIDATTSTASAAFVVDGVVRSKLLVTYTFAGPAPVAKLTTSVYLTPGGGLCANFTTPVLRPGYVTRRDVTAAVPDTSAVGETLTLEDSGFRAGAALTITVLGYGTDPSSPIAFGCVDLPSLGMTATTAAAVTLSAWN